MKRKTKTEEASEFHKRMSDYTEWMTKHNKELEEKKKTEEGGQQKL